MLLMRLLVLLLLLVLLVLLLLLFLRPPAPLPLRARAMDSHDSTAAAEAALKGRCSALKLLIDAKVRVCLSRASSRRWLVCTWTNRNRSITAVVMAITSIVIGIITGSQSRSSNC